MRLHFSREAFDCTWSLLAPFSKKSSVRPFLPLRTSMTYTVKLMRNPPPGSVFGGASASLSERFFFFVAELNFERSYWIRPDRSVIRLYVEGQGRGQDAFDDPRILYREEINVDAAAKALLHDTFDELNLCLRENPDRATSFCREQFGNALSIDGVTQQLESVDEHITGYDLIFVPDQTPSKWKENVAHSYRITAIGIQSWDSTSLPIVVADVTKDLNVRLIVDPEDQVVPVDAIDYRSNFFFGGESFTPTVVSGAGGFTLRSKEGSWVFPGSVVFSWGKGALSLDDEIEFVDLELFDPTLVLNAKYASEDNVFETAFYPENRLFLRRPVAERLSRVQRKLRRMDLGLKVFDGFRPVGVQRRMREKIDDDNFVAKPGQSKHNQGCAVDVTLVDDEGRELEMPTAYDAFEERAHADYD